MMVRIKSILRKDELMEVTLQALKPEDLEQIWQDGYLQADPEWSHWNAPYFQDYRPYPDFDDFLRSSIGFFLQSHQCLGIFVDTRPVGMVSRHWEDRRTRWLEIGICIYNPVYWSQGIGQAALKQWMARCFDDFSEIEHLGLTTWSGNKRMMKLAEKISLKEEGRIRQVRYWQNFYYDSLKYGILRSEWESLTNKFEINPDDQAD